MLFAAGSRSKTTRISRLICRKIIKFTLLFPRDYHRSVNAKSGAFRPETKGSAVPLCLNDQVVPTINFNAVKADWNTYKVSSNQLRDALPKIHCKWLPLSHLRLLQLFFVLFLIIALLYHIIVIKLQIHLNNVPIIGQ